MFTPHVLTPASRRSRMIMLIGLIVLTPLVAVAAASTGKVSRCGYVRSSYGRNAVYPWHMGCSAAEKIVVGSDAKANPQIAFTAPGTDGGAVKINGVWWVCTGDMGDYECGFPYRPTKTRQGTGFTGPFTKAVVFQACSLDQGNDICQKTATFSQPPR